IQPVISEYAQRAGAISAGSYLSRMASYPLILATLAAIFSPFLSQQVLSILFGASYFDVAPTLDILALSVVPFCLVMVAARGLVANGAQHVDLLANAVGVVACLAAGVLLIPQYGARGAAMAQLFSFSLMALLEIVYLSRRAVGFSLWHPVSLSSVCLTLSYIILWKY
ncbi:MAG TPA: polysaccharide biosynthesis C-terminal domain-containing protein, partial [Pyrinomonadaceae bacterium]|nr:polysaccharide biosynthesis C-terminal domain-containing protein [Pyrinomonadaceae bacterium]